MNSPQSTTTANREDVTFSRDVVKFLQQPSAYEERTARVDCIETHISWVFLTDRFVYKLKKPVKFDFLDFSSVARRREACEDEVRLNRRLAPHVYLRVVPVCAHKGKLRFNGKGEAVDWVVKMRRLPAERAMDRLIESGRISDRDVDEITDLLIDFYAQCPPLTIRTEDYRREIADHLVGNWRELSEPCHELDSVAVRRVHETQWRFLRLMPELLDTRVLDGRIVEGHGDLRPEHLYLAPAPIAIDCIEFNRDFRQLDVLDELCFLAMECAKMRADWIGQRLLDRYQQKSGDQIGDRLAAFYQSYRACVRAKVCALRAEQVEPTDRRAQMAEAAEYLRLANQFAQTLGRPLLIVVRGLTGSGKSTVADELASRLEIKHLQTDVIRRELFGARENGSGYGKGIYQPEHKERVYNELLQRAEKLLGQGCSAILDGTFLTVESRLKTREMAQRMGLEPLFVVCQCPAEIAKQRIAARLADGGALSESRPEIYQRQAEDEAPDPDGLKVLHIDSTEPPAASADAVIAELRQSIAK